MAYSINRPLRDYSVEAFSTSIGATPVTAYATALKRGRILKIYVTQNGAVTGTSAIAVAINGGTPISGLALSVTGGGAGSQFSSSLSTDVADNVAAVNEGDVISLTPSGATGSVQGSFGILIRS